MILTETPIFVMFMFMSTPNYRRVTWDDINKECEFSNVPTFDDGSVDIGILEKILDFPWSYLYSYATKGGLYKYARIRIKDDSCEKLNMPL